MKIDSFQSLAVLPGCVLLGAAVSAAGDVQATDFADANAKISVYTARDCTHLARTVPGAFMRRANGHDGISLGKYMWSGAASKSVPLFAPKIDW